MRTIVHLSLPSLRTERLFVVSSLAFILVNTFENILHYSLGKRSSDRSGWGIQIELPHGRDMIRFIGIMIIFSVLQGVITAWAN
jgi:hypothetical protein